MTNLGFLGHRGVFYTGYAELVKVEVVQNFPLSKGNFIVTNHQPLTSILVSRDVRLSSLCLFFGGVIMKFL